MRAARKYRCARSCAHWTLLIRFRARELNGERMQITISVALPFCGRIACNGVIFAWLVSRGQISALPTSLTETELYAHVRAHEPRADALFALAGLTHLVETLESETL